MIRPHLHHLADEEAYYLEGTSRSTRDSQRSGIRPPLTFRPVRIEQRQAFRPSRHDGTDDRYRRMFGQYFVDQERISPEDGRRCSGAFEDQVFQLVPLYFRRVLPVNYGAHRFLEFDGVGGREEGLQHEVHRAISSFPKGLISSRVNWWSVAVSWPWAWAWYGLRCVDWVRSFTASRWPAGPVLFTIAQLHRIHLAARLLLCCCYPSHRKGQHLPLVQTGGTLAGSAVRPSEAKRATSRFPRYGVRICCPP